MFINCVIHCIRFYTNLVKGVSTDALVYLVCCSARTIDVEFPEGTQHDLKPKNRQALANCDPSQDSGPFQHIQT